MTRSAEQGVVLLLHEVGGDVEGEVGPLDAGLAAPGGAPQLWRTHSRLAHLVQLRQVRRRRVHRYDKRLEAGRVECVAGGFVEVIAAGEVHISWPGELPAPGGFQCSHSEENQADRHEKRLRHLQQAQGELLLGDACSDDSYVIEG